MSLVCKQKLICPGEVVPSLMCRQSCLDKVNLGEILEPIDLMQFLAQKSGKSVSLDTTRRQERKENEGTERN
jgi:hypothetical protein